jgi:hypothetical protein
MDLEEQKNEIERNALEKKRKDLDEMKSKARAAFMAKAEICRLEKHLLQDI